MVPNNKYFLILALWLVSSVAICEDDEKGLDIAQAVSNTSPEVPNPEAVRAFREYWRSFELYEQKVLNDAKVGYQQNWEQLKSEYGLNYQKLTSDQLERLNNAAEKYKNHLKAYPNAENRPFVMLNLAQILNMIAETNRSEEERVDSAKKADALGLLKELESKYPDFSGREEALYLRAIILESMARRDDALAVWKILAADAKNKMHSVYANVAVGDYYFQRDEPIESVKSYQRARKILEGLIQQPDYEFLRIEYRLSWAAYRAANLKLATEMAEKLLKPARMSKSNDTRIKIQQDAVEIMGDSLYELNDQKTTKRILAKKDLSNFAPAVALRLMKRYGGNKIFEKAADIGEFISRQYPLAKEAPDFLFVLADVYKSLGQEAKRAATLERIAILMPDESLWRSRFHDDYDVVKNMEEKAKIAASEAADYYFSYGSNTGNANSFMTAASMYQILIQKEQLGDESNKFRLKQAHCYFFANRLDEAATAYSDLKQKYKLQPAVLELAAYQLVLTREKQWRKVFEEQVAKGIPPSKDPVTIEQLKNLELAVEEFANRFPGQGRAVDLLLVAASANRDQERFPEARKYWERALVSDPLPPQRAIAVRGLILATMKTGSSFEVVELARRFLQLEDLKNIDQSLGDELLGVLSLGATNEADRLNKEGKVLEAGTLLVRVAQEFKRLPERDKIYRDGAYMLAIAGEWVSAQEAALAYQKENLRENAGDMLYLQARAEEFQIRFANASKSYLGMGKKFPKHPRSYASLQRSENLALAENDYVTAAQAAELLGDRASSREEKLLAYEKSVKYFNEAGESEEALRVAQKRKGASGNLSAETIRSEMLVAEALYDSGSETSAIANLKQLAQKTQRQRDTLEPNAFAEVSGKTNFLLGEEARAQFEDFSIFERKGSIAENINQKSKYFEAMAKTYDQAIASNHPEWSSRARFELASAAEAFADEIQSVRKRSKEGVSERNLKKYNETADRLRRFAKRYYSSNLMARNKDPESYKNNEWINKSAVKLTGYGEIDYRPSREQSLPKAVPLEMPYQWSL